MPSMVVLRTSNTSTAPAAAKRILRVAVSQQRAKKNQPQPDQATSESNMQVGNGSATSYNDGNGYVEEGYSYGYNQTMGEKKGCRIDTAPSGTHHTTSVDSCDAQDPDPMAEGIGLVTTSRSDEDGGLNNEYRDKPENNQRPTSTESPKIRPSTM